MASSFLSGAASGKYDLAISANCNRVYVSPSCKIAHPGNLFNAGTGTEYGNTLASASFAIGPVRPAAGRLHVSDDTVVEAIAESNHDDSINAPQWELRRARGTHTARTAVADGTWLGHLSAQGWTVRTGSVSRASRRKCRGRLQRESCRRSSASSS